jgi:Zn-dependent metalloprotease
MRAFLILVTFVRNGPSAWAGQESSRLIAKHVSRTTSYFSGRNLVVVKEGRRLSRIDHLTHTDVQEAASETLQNILLDHLNYSGEETIVLTQHNVRTSSQSHHFKFKQHLHGLPIEGASIAMHVHENGTVYALNGEFHSSSSIGASEQALDCEEAMNLARNEEYGSEEEGWEWLSDCVDAAVQGRDGKAHFAFKRWLGRRHNNGISSGDFLFASRNDGSVLAVHPQVSRARSLATYDCESGTDTEECSLVSDSPDKIAISDVVAQDAHNHVVDVYDFYAANFGWNSFDGQDAAEIQVFVHFNLSFSDSYFFPHANGGGLVFGDGDGRHSCRLNQSYINPIFSSSHKSCHRDLSDLLFARL